MLDESDQPFLTNLVKKGSNVPVKNVVHAPGCDSDAERIQRIVLSAPWSKSVTEPEELFLIYAVQYRNGRPLDDLVFQGGHREWALPSVCLQYIRPA
jgi:hypothetical protein